MKMKKLIFVAITFLLLTSVSVFAQERDFGEAKALIDSEISCDKLTDEQLEEIGEYYMEQMHPAESHEAMHKMMGFAEGTSEEVQFHINLAKAMYCGSSTFGMMEGGNMMGGQAPQTNMMQRMMGNYWGGGTFGTPLLSSALFVWTIVGLLAIIWLLKNLSGKKK